MEPQQEGITLALTPGEANLARSVFGSTISIEAWWFTSTATCLWAAESVHGDEPEWELYFRKALYRSDFTVHHLAQHPFIHEMAHVWQYQRGMWVRTRGLLSWAVSYQYRLDQPLLRHYSMEQLVSIIADYFILKRYRVKLELLLKSIGIYVCY
ncbi:type IV secretion protein Rhs [Serratia marcescens]|uniref:type IV secretion protein Rhs n=1 Tax=Serratia marcescens TaxID=615 RepID=UPI003B87B309